MVEADKMKNGFVVAWVVVLVVVVVGAAVVVLLTPELIITFWIASVPKNWKDYKLHIFLFLKKWHKSTAFWIPAFKSAQGRSWDEWNVVTIVADLSHEFSNFHFDEFQHLLISCISLYSKVIKLVSINQETISNTLLMNTKMCWTPICLARSKCSLVWGIAPSVALLLW